jgi:signal transduction histidine kinase
MKILAIDDNPDNLITIQALIMDMFREAAVVKAHSGPEGFKYALADPPDVILLDILMPGMDGFDVCRLFKTEPSLADIPVIFLTAAKGDRQNRVQALEAGGEGFLSKPVDEIELKAQVSAMMRLKQSRDEKKHENQRLEKLVELRTQELVRQLGELTRSEEALRKNMEELVKAKEKAETADRLKSAFLANVSHEIRTPMNAIVGFADILTDMEITTTEKEQYAHIIRVKSDDLLHLITEILDIASLESGNATVNFSEVIVDQLLADLEKQILRQLHRLEKTTLEFSIRIPVSGIPLVIKSDPFIIIQVLTHLLDNAIRYTDAGIVTLGYELPAENLLTFFVSDTGIGIDPADHEIIFLTFRQAELAERPKYGGTGLGLAICRQSAKLLGGEVTMKSTPGQGSTFYFSIPISIVEKVTPMTTIQTNQTENVRSTDLSGKRILIIEDDPTNMEYLQILLNQVHAETDCAFTGEEVKQKMDELGSFDLVLLDIRLPDTNGWELAREIKRRYPRLPVIAQTAYAMSSDRKMSLEAGCDGYLAKPIRKDDLFSVFEQFFH